VDLASKGRATLQQVAELAHVSVSTASRVLNDTGYSSSDARSRVLVAAHQLKYQPDLRARGLRKRASLCIGLVIPDLLNVYYTRLADTVTQLLSDRGYHLILASTRDRPAHEIETILGMVGQSVDGLIWVPTSPNADIIQLLYDHETPAVAIVRRILGDVIDTIMLDDLAGSRASILHLFGLGHKRVGFVGGDIRYSNYYDCWQGYIEAHKKAGLSVDEQLVKLGPPRSAWVMQAVHDLLRMEHPPTALLVASNSLMPEVMSVLRQHHINIPSDMSIVSFDDIPWFSYSVPSITAVRADHERLAEMAVDLLMRRIEETSDADPPPLFLNVGFELIVRESTAPPRQQPLSLAGSSDWREP
jgi:LacI family transcriptional regulator